MNEKVKKASWVALSLVAAAAIVIFVAIAASRWALSDDTVRACAKPAFVLSFLAAAGAGLGWRIFSRR